MPRRRVSDPAGAGPQPPLRRGKQEGRPIRISINRIELEITPVASHLRAALLSDPIIAQGVWRDVWRWDGQTGTALVALTPNSAVPLPNGLSFFVPRAGISGVVTANPGPSKRMADKFLAAVGANSIPEVIRSVNSILPLPQKTLPLDAFAPLNPVASYVVKSHVDFSVVQLRNAGRNLTAYLFVPGQVAFHQEVTAISDHAAFDALMEAEPHLRAIQPAFVVPARTKANLDIRRLALRQRIEELRAPIEQISAASRGEGAPPDEGITREVARVLAEWQALAQAATAAAAKTRPAGHPGVQPVR